MPGLGSETRDVWVRYRAVSGPDALAAVGTLRRRAYAQAGKVDASPAPLLDDLDAAPHARVLVLEERGRPVATARLVFPGQHDEVDHDAYFTWPSALPAKERAAEISRVAVEPGRSRAGWMRAILMASILDMLRQGRRFMVGSAAGRLLSHYVRIGCVPIGYTYRHELLGNLEHHVFYGDAVASLRWETAISPLVWARMFAPIYHRARRERLALVAGRPGLGPVAALCAWAQGAALDSRSMPPA